MRGSKFLHQRVNNVCFTCSIWNQQIVLTASRLICSSNRKFKHSHDARTFGSLILELHLCFFSVYQCFRNNCGGRTAAHSSCSIVRVTLLSVSTTTYCLSILHITYVFRCVAFVEIGNYDKIKI